VYNKLRQVRKGLSCRIGPLRLHLDVWVVLCHIGLFRWGIRPLRIRAELGQIALGYVGALNHLGHQLEV
jgi:hypothetical protein